MNGARTSGMGSSSDSRVSRLGRRLLADSSGNTLAIAATALLMLLAAVGGGVDMSRAYMTKTNLQAACDAGVLAGRRALSKSGVYGSTEKAAADKMFHFNMHAKQTSSHDIKFDTVAHDDGSVVGTASVVMPTIIMQMFGMEQFDMDVECSAELQMASADVMFVLDVTGSMAGTKIQGLRDAVRDFHKTVAGAVIDKEKTVIRYAFVPYSQTVNASGIVASGAMKPEWFANVSGNFSTKVAVFDTPFTIYPTLNTSASTTGPLTYETYGSNITQTQCTSYGNNAYPTPAGPNPVVGTENGPTPRTSTQYGAGTWTKTSGSGSSAKGTCTRSKRVTSTPWNSTVVYKFSRYEYKKVNLDYGRMLPGGSLTVMKSTGLTTSHYVPTAGTYDLRQLAKMVGQTNVSVFSSPTTSVTASACIEERKTVMNYAMNPVPDDAWDLKINEEPEDDDDGTKWRPMLRDLYYNPSSGALVPTPACPAPMRQFEKVDTTDPDVPDWLGTYLDNLVATGSTYHDIGMIWGARLASTRGMYADNVLDGDRNSVSRHIIFMTDGQMEPTNSAYSSYGIESIEHRVAPAGSTDGANSTLASYHNNRFLAACQKAKEEGYTVWLVGFGTTLTTVMKTCSSANRAYQANNTEELKAAFRYIAGQVADLRINK